MAAIFVAGPLFNSIQPVYANTASETEEIQQKIQENTQKVNNAKKDVSSAKKNQSTVQAEITTLKNKIAVVSSSIARVEDDIAIKETEIAAKEEEIVQKQLEIEAQQVEIDEQWSGFKQRMAAMQEMKDSGTMSILSALNNLYQFLTFSEVLQDISNKDSQIMDDMEFRLSELDAAKNDLENQRASLKEQKLNLESQKETLKAQKKELDSHNAELTKKLIEAKAVTSAAEAALDAAEDELAMSVEELNKLLEAANVANLNISFSGFACPLRNYTRISSGYGTRNNPTGSGIKMHYGQDWAAPSGTPIYAAAAGYVVSATYSSSYGNYVLLYHGTMGDGNTYSTLYAHMVYAPSVSSGTYVAQGQLIGYVGTTGNSTGNHLHLEVWRGSSVNNTTSNKAERVNPASYVPLR